MIDLTIVKTVATRVFWQNAFIIKKHSPELLLAAGVIGVVTSTVMACKATLKVEAILDEANEKIEKIKHAEQTVNKEKYTEQDYRKDLMTVRVQSGIKLVKLYGPAITLSAASIACFLGAHNIMQKRNVALIAAYKAVEKGFADYRRRVVDELGEDKDRQFRYGAKKEVVTEIEVGEDGKPKKVKKTVDIVDPNEHSVYARFFDESSAQWNHSAEHNLIFLKCQQNFANDLLRARGHLFLNEVYDMLGIPRSGAGAVVGWRIGLGDDFVDFGIFEYGKHKVRDFVNGYEPAILLDFNVDGVIYDKI